MYFNTDHLVKIDVTVMITPSDLQAGVREIRKNLLELKGLTEAGSFLLETGEWSDSIEFLEVINGRLKARFQFYGEKPEKQPKEAVV